jgi:hypothetical protein
MKKAMINYIAEAVSNWPEDEAYGLFRTYQARLAEDCENDTDREYEQMLLCKDAERMRGIIAKATDGNALVLRFNAELNKLMA